MKKERYAFVKYIDGISRLWIYKCDDSFAVDDVVEAPVFDYAYNNIAIIKKIKNLSDKQLPIEKNKILTISNKLDKQKYEKVFHPLTYMKNYIKKECLKGWSLSTKNIWFRIYSSTFGGQISYENDGVLTYSLGSYKNNDLYEDYTMTSPKNLKTKINFVKTILFELYHDIINKEQFQELIDIV